MIKETGPYVISIYGDSTYDKQRNQAWHLMTIDKFSVGNSEPYKKKSFYISEPVYRSFAFSALLNDKNFIDRKLFILKNNTKIKNLKVEYSLEMEVN